MVTQPGWEAVAPGIRASMRANRSTDTNPELRLRSLLWAIGYRYRMHGRALPGKPDLVFSRRKCVVFMHGCFWHQHEGCRRASRPRTRLEYWLPKLARNKERDARVVEELSRRGWRIFVVWECELEHIELTASRVMHFLGPRVARTRVPR